MLSPLLVHIGQRVVAVSRAHVNQDPLGSVGQRCKAAGGIDDIGHRLDLSASSGSCSMAFFQIW